MQRGRNKVRPRGCIWMSARSAERGCQVLGESGRCPNGCNNVDFAMSTLVTHPPEDGGIADTGRHLSKVLQTDPWRQTLRCLLLSREDDHPNRMMHKMGVRTVADFVRIAERASIVPSHRRD